MTYNPRYEDWFAELRDRIAVVKVVVAAKRRATLEKYLSSPYESVRFAIAQHSLATTEMLELLAKDEDEAVSLEAQDALLKRSSKSQR